MVAASKPSLPPVPPNDNVAHALAGSGGGLLSMALTYPLVTLSTRAQVDSAKSATPFLATARSIIAREGLSGLYSGLNSALFGISVTNFVYYFWYEWCKTFFENRAVRLGRTSRRLSTAEAMAAGAFAGAATVIVTNPIWVVNTRVTTGAKPSSATASPTTATMPKKPHGAIPTLISLLKNEGPSALFSGVVPALVLVVNPILQYTLFEQLKNALERRKHKVSPTLAFLLGAFTKLVATATTYPYITLKTQMHVSKSEEGMMATMKKLVKTEGWGRMYQGIGAKLLHSVLTAAFLFAFKDVLYERIARSRMKRAVRA